MLIVVRNGRTEANAQGLLLGRRLDPELDELGRRQAATPAGAIEGASRVVSSPLRRARQTAEAIGLPVEVDERWGEMDYGSLDSTARSEEPPDPGDRWGSAV